MNDIYIKEYDIEKKEKFDKIQQEIINYANDNIIPILKDILSEDEFTKAESLRGIFLLFPSVLMIRANNTIRLDPNLRPIVNSLMNKITKEQEEILNKHYKYLDELFDKRNRINYSENIIKHYVNRPELYNAILSLKSKRYTTQFIPVTKTMLSKLKSKYRKNDFVFGTGNRPSSKENVELVEQFLKENQIELNQKHIMDQEFKKMIQKETKLPVREIHNIITYLFNKQSDLFLFNKLLDTKKYWGKDKTHMLFVSLA